MIMMLLMLKITMDFPRDPHSSGPGSWAAFLQLTSPRVLRVTTRVMDFVRKVLDCQVGLAAQPLEDWKSIIPWESVVEKWSVWKSVSLLSLPPSFGDQLGG